MGVSWSKVDQEEKGESTEHDPMNMCQEAESKEGWGGGDGLKGCHTVKGQQLNSVSAWVTYLHGSPVNSTSMIVVYK